MTDLDILSKIILRDSMPKMRGYRVVKRYQVMYAGRASRKVYTWFEGRKLVARAKRMGLDCYLSPLTIRVEVK